MNKTSSTNSALGNAPNTSPRKPLISCLLSKCVMCFLRMCCMCVCVCVYEFMHAHLCVCFHEGDRSIEYTLTQAFCPPRTQNIGILFQDRLGGNGVQVRCGWVGGSLLVVCHCRTLRLYRCVGVWVFLPLQYNCVRSKRQRGTNGPTHMHTHAHEHTRIYTYTHSLSRSLSLAFSLSHTHTHS